MIPPRMSASGLDTYENCPSRYHAEYILRTPDFSSNAADKGTCAHAVLERWVIEDHYLIGSDFSKMQAILEEEYPKLFKERTWFKEVEGMLKNWFNRSQFDYWFEREVLLAEVKEFFPIKLLDGTEVTTTYIWDRCDELADGSIEVVDYKSFAQPVQPEDLRAKIQPRMYALAAQLRFPHIEHVWVTYDLLRFDQVSLKFTKQDNRDTWTYLREQYQKIYDDNPTGADDEVWPQERLNGTCRWCVRRGSCQTVAKQIAGGGIMAVQSVEEAANRRAKLDFAVGAAKREMDELGDYILEHMKLEEITEFETDEVKVEAKMRSKREADMPAIIRLLPPELVADYGAITMTELDKILKSDLLDADTASQIKQKITKRPGNVFIKTKTKTDAEELFNAT